MPQREMPNLVGNCHSVAGLSILRPLKNGLTYLENAFVNESERLVQPHFFIWPNVKFEPLKWARLGGKNFKNSHEIWGQFICCARRQSQSPSQLLDVIV